MLDQPLGFILLRYVYTASVSPLNAIVLYCEPYQRLIAIKIFPANVRAKGLGIAASGQSVGAIIVGQVWPVAVSNIGPRVYFIFMSFNLLALVLVYGFYPETARKTLEEIDSHFGRNNVHGPQEGTVDDLKAEAKVEMEEMVAKRV